MTGEVIGMVKIVAAVVVEIVYVGTVFVYVDVVHVDVVIEGIVIAGGVVTAIVVAAVPSRITVVGSSVIDHGRSMPAAVPVAVTPTAAATAHHCPDGDSGSETYDASRRDVSCAITRSYVRTAINYGRIVLGNIDHLRIRGLDDDHLRRLLNYSHLRSGLEVALCFCLRPQGLDSGHDLSLLIVISLSERGGPAEVLRHVVEHRRKLRQRLNTWIPGLLVDGLHQGAAG